MGGASPSTQGLLRDVSYRAVPHNYPAPRGWVKAQIDSTQVFANLSKAHGVSEYSCTVKQGRWQDKALRLPKPSPAQLVDLHVLLVQPLTSLHESYGRPVDGHVRDPVMTGRDMIIEETIGHPRCSHYGRWISASSASSSALEGHMVHKGLTSSHTHVDMDTLSLVKLCTPSRPRSWASQ